MTNMTINGLTASTQYQIKLFRPSAIDSSDADYLVATTSCVSDGSGVLTVALVPTTGTLYYYAVFDNNTYAFTVPDSVNTLNIIDNLATPEKTVVKYASVTSVNGQTGDVELSMADLSGQSVQSVNNKTGAVVLSISDFEGTFVQSVNSKSGVVTLAAADVGAVPSGSSASAVSAVPNTATVNGKLLTSDPTLAAADVGALPNTTTAKSLGAVIEVNGVGPDASGNAVIEAGRKILNASVTPALAQNGAFCSNSSPSATNGNYSLGGTTFLSDASGNTFEMPFVSNDPTKTLHVHLECDLMVQGIRSSAGSLSGDIVIQAQGVVLKAGGEVGSGETFVLSHLDSTTPVHVGTRSSNGPIVTPFAIRHISEDFYISLAGVSAGDALVFRLSGTMTCVGCSASDMFWVGVLDTNQTFSGFAAFGDPAILVEEIQL